MVKTACILIADPIPTSAGEPGPSTFHVKGDATCIKIPYIEDLSRVVIS